MNWIWLIPTGLFSFMIGWFLCGIFWYSRINYWSNLCKLTSEENDLLKAEIIGLRKIKSCGCNTPVCEDKYSLS